METVDHVFWKGMPTKAWNDGDDGPVNFGEPTYWDKRYARERKELGVHNHYDWYLRLENIKAIIETYFGVPKGQRVLVVGCGNSTLPMDLYNMGYKYITSIDISTFVVSQMQQRYEHLEGMEFIVADAMKLDAFPDDTFDCIMDKGCVDSLFCGLRSSDDVLEMSQECCRVLRPGGVFLCVSHGEPDTRLHIFRHVSIDWNANAIPVYDSEGLFVYTMTKETQDERDERRRRLEAIIAKPHVDGPKHSSVKSKNYEWTPINTIAHRKAPHEQPEGRGRHGHDPGAEPQADNVTKDRETAERKRHARHEIEQAERKATEEEMDRRGIEPPDIPKSGLPPSEPWAVPIN